MRAVAYWALAELRRRWPATLALTLLVALACAVPVAAAAGARRTGSVVDRLADELRPGDVSVQVEELDDDALAAIEGLPGVEVAAVRSTIFLRPSGTDLQPFVEFFAVGSFDGVSGYDLVRPRIDEGRLPARDAADEVLLTRPLADRLGLSPGDSVSVDTLTMDAVFASFETGTIPEPDGPEVELIVTGVGTLGAELLAPEQIPYGSMFFGPAFLAGHPELAAFSDIVDVQLAGGADDVPEFVDRVRDVLGAEIFVSQTAQELDQVRDGVGIQRTALLVFLLVAAVAGAVAVAQAASRTATQHDTDLEALAALGFSGAQRVSALVLLFVPAVLAGTAAGGAVAVLASGRTTFGLAARLEPDPGVQVDGLVVGLGAGLTILAALLAVAVAALLTDRRRLQTGAPLEPAWVSALANWAEPPGAIGIRWALVPGRGRTATPVRSALLGTAIGVGGALAALSFGASMTRLTDTPARFGVNHDLEVSPFGDESPDDEARAAADELSARDGVAAVTLVRVGKLGVDGTTHDAFGIDPRRGSIGFSLVDGRSPIADHEVVVGDALLDELDVGIGDELLVDGATEPLAIVGRAVFPPLDDGNSLATGVGFTLTGLAATIDHLGDEGSSSGFPVLLVDAEPGQSVDALRRSLALDLGDARIANRPTSVGNLDEARQVPPLVAAFLGLLGLLALAHTIVASASRRRADLAVLRSLGFERRQLAATVRSHTLATTTIALLVGLPLGVALGRWLWRLVASGLGVATDPAGVGIAVVALTVASVLAALLLATPSARSAARTSPAIALRAE